MKTLFFDKICRFCHFFAGMALVLIGLTRPLAAQVTFPQNGVYDERAGLYAFKNATIYKSWNLKIEKATLLVRQGKIENVGTDIVIPPDAVVFDCTGKTIYPSFIESFSNYGMPEAKPESAPQRGPQMLSNKKGAFSWNEGLKSEFRAHEAFAQSEKDAEAMRALGFGAVLSHRFDGISRGSAVLVSTATDREHKIILKPWAGHVLSFSKGTSSQMYPSSLMGGISLLRQTYLDGSWYAAGVQEERNFSLEAWNNLQNLPQIFEVGDKLEALRAQRIGSEFGKKYILKGRGDEYQRLDDIKSSGAAGLIVGLSFPETYDLEDPYDALQIPLSDLKHWELAASNPARIAAAGIDFAFTTHLLRDKKDFLKQVQKAIEAGLSEADALKALTETPAKLLGISDLGALEKGKIGNFFITDKSIFSKDAKIFHHWVGEKGYVLADLNKPTIRGNFSFQVGKNVYQKLTISETGDVQGFKSDTIKFKIDFTQNQNMVLLSFTPSDEKQVVRLNGVYEGGSMRGRGQLGDGTWVNWEADPLNNTTTTSAAKKEETAAAAKPKEVIGDINYPFGAYGRKELPKAVTVLFKNATVWTGEAAGILTNTDVLVENGKIAKLGKNISAPANTQIVDATDKHLTAGIIDEHSHIAISKGVNEGSQSSTSEVRIGDVVNSEDVNIYRQLAGGVTASHLLHGSANAIGGQTQLIKLRFGFAPEKLKVEAWDGFIKFALGENVKQSNWGDENRVRFPQTRMGVEQVYNDHFTRAKEYLAVKKSGKPYRRDLELDALGEILEKKRFITCHSYVQSEITMLMRVAENFGFVVNTYTHILEGYKVADKMAKHGAAAAGFADWWAYKPEVSDAIPQNAMLMQQQGVLSAINSDNAEMARRLNQEAAKSVKYAGMGEHDAWKMVTINPAIMLHVGTRTGSVKEGKDADVVLWSANPLSIYARAEQTYVDGIRFFDIKEDLELRKSIQAERARLVQKSIQMKKGGAPTQAATARVQRMYDCEDFQDELSEREGAEHLFESAGHKH
jgi:imidazolonepropionase-like amidohydrolase